MTDRIENDVKIDQEGQCRKFMCILTYGCQMNENDSERFAGQLKGAGYQFTDKLDQADLIIINTCCVRESAEKKIYGKIGELKKLKAVNPNLLIGIAGCMAQKDQEKIFKKASHIDFIIGTHNVHKLAELVAEVENKKEKVLAVWEQAEQMSPDVPTVHKGQVSAYVPIMYGCNNFCTYCIVPYVRGRERSRPVEDILKEINHLAAEGFKEVTLLGQNVNSYGKDKQEMQGFAKLLEAVDRFSAVERIRYMTSHPRDMSDAVIDVISHSTRICEHFHLPIQSGSDEILEKMNRGYSTEYYLSLIKKIRKLVPNASITTDIIVGFPGETEELFLETIQLLKEIRFDAAYTFIYSQRSGTPAAVMPGQVPLAEKKIRLQRLMTMQNDISLDINRSLQGQTLEVLVEGPSKNDETRWMGRTRTNKIVLWDKKGMEKVGQLLPIHIVNAQTWLLKGQLLS